MILKMSLTDTQIEELCKKMNVDLAGCYFKDELPPLEFNKGYLVNLEDEFNEKGELNVGSHWTAFVVVKYPTGKIDPIYFDAFGCPPPEEVKDKIEKFAKVKYLPHNTKDIQSMMANCCGWFCVAFLHYLSNFSHRTGDVYEDTETFLSYFDDLNTSVEFKKNEYILKHFFQSKDPTLRREIEVIADPNNITEDSNGGIDLSKV